MPTVLDFNTSWTFLTGFDVERRASLQSGEAVVLPHNAVELPFSYCDEKSYQQCFTYQRELEWVDAFEGHEVTLHFEAAMANAVVYLNGEEVGAHPDGYTPFVARLTEHLVKGNNVITVKIDGSENPDIPPFGGRIDYLTYAGIYRDVSLRISAPVSIGNIKMETADVLESAKSVFLRCYLDNPQELTLEGTIEALITDTNGAEVARQSSLVTQSVIELQFDQLQGVSVWDLDNPALYKLECRLANTFGTDTVVATFGFRTAEFRPDGFFLNGKHLKLMGLNRHQSFPYSGYAQGRYSQERDAEILKHELACNVVRTSHYPQSTWFLDHCDRLGLLVFEEIPGWQHVGGEAWKRQAVDNVRGMIERDWNHPSIITWGVRINESADDHDFYAATNTLARELDSTRQTSGIRHLQNSEFLEDIYTMNDFTQGCEELTGDLSSRVVLKEQKQMTGLDTPVPYVVTECNGHMFPTKTFDQEQRQAEHVIRHLNVLNHAFGDPDIAGCIAWCMFDYNTHQDFGSGDGICHHGVMSMFREPKFAASVYASQGDPIRNPVMTPVTFWARGERNIGGVLPLIILTNLDEVELRFANGHTRRFKPSVDEYPHLPHPPVIIRDTDIPTEEFGRWGMRWTDMEFVGFLNGEPAQTLSLVANSLPARMSVEADKQMISASDREEVRIMVRALDQQGSKLPFIADQATIELSGPADLIGPKHSPIVGGATGFWIRANGDVGNIEIRITSNHFEPQELTVIATDRIAM